MPNGRWKVAVLAVLPASLAVAMAGPANAAVAADANAQASTSSPAFTAAAKLAGQRAALPGARVTAEDALKAYWTPARMKAARPADDQAAVKDAARVAEKTAASEVATAHREAAEGSSPKGVRPPAKVTPTDAVKSSPALKADGASRLEYTPGYQYWEFAARTSGKVYFTNTKDGYDYVCSGTIVNSGGKDLVWTAGHCVTVGRAATGTPTGCSFRPTGAAGRRTATGMRRNCGPRTRGSTAASRSPIWVSRSSARITATTSSTTSAGRASRGTSQSTSA